MKKFKIKQEIAIKEIVNWDFQLQMWCGTEGRMTLSPSAPGTGWEAGWSSSRHPGSSQWSHPEGT